MLLIVIVVIVTEQKQSPILLCRGRPGGVGLSVDSTTFLQIFYNLQEDTKSTILQILQFDDILTKIFYNLQFFWPKSLSTNLQDLLKKTVDSTTKIGRNLQSTFTWPPPPLIKTGPKPDQVRYLI